MIQTDLFAARAKGHAAAKRSADRAGMAWQDHAITYLCSYVRNCLTPFLAEDVVQFACRDGLCPEPPDARAWGHVMQRAKRMGLIEPCGYRAARSSNGSPKVLWRAKR